MITKTRFTVQRASHPAGHIWQAVAPSFASEKEATIYLAGLRKQNPTATLRVRRLRFLTTRH